MGYVFDFNDAMTFQEWAMRPHNRFVAEFENRLMFDLLKPLRGKSVLDIGCGTGTSLVPLLESGLQVTGIDPSPYMLDLASRRVGNRVDLYRGAAENLPFDDNSFNYSCMLTVLEFVDDPKKAIEEACRVTRDRLFLGIINRHAIKAIRFRLRGMFTRSIYNHAHFFSIWEIKQILRETLGEVPISWRTICLFSAGNGRISKKIEQSDLVQRCPFGMFAGVVVAVQPRFTTRNLPIACPANIQPAG
jgi:SAM-dependent methyltransferase